MLIHVSVGETCAEVPVLVCGKRGVLTNMDRIPALCTHPNALLHSS